ncbi:hypothetical protein EXIGLDRAFT_833953 [Exidia glandulosa HHB12029]|uniref:Uncharacterized protein n=1 Tax=Exidia glandulosa HHB12029 TaxID=1314781 RepID=A0A165KA18_EXIGL|nr:hypothetical protein EXIGLDRAFT_833953 [Exidia glandulosa HHB12029]
MGQPSVDISPETFYALRRRDADPCKPPAGPRNAVGTTVDKEMRRGWLSLTALSSFCVRNSNESFAAGFYPHKDDEGRFDGIAIAIAGKGPDGVPQETQSFLKIVFGLLRVYAGLNRTQASKEKIPLRDSLIKHVLDFSWDHWRSKLYESSVDIFDERAEAVRAKLGPSQLQEFNILLEHINMIRALTASLDAPNSNKQHLAREIRHLKLWLNKDSTLGLMNVVDVGSCINRAEINHILDFKNVLVDVSCHLEGDEPGRLMRDFSLTAYALNIAAVARQAARIGTIVMWRPDFFRDNPHIVFLAPVRRTIAVQPVHACANISKVEDIDPDVMKATSVSGFLHPPMNLLQHLLRVAEPGIQIFPAIGTSSLLCYGCDRCLRTFNSYQPRRMSGRPGKDVAFAGTSGKIIPWISPRYHIRGGSRPLKIHMDEGIIRTARWDVMEHLSVLSASSWRSASMWANHPVKTLRRPRDVVDEISTLCFSSPDDSPRSARQRIKVSHEPTPDLILD